MEVNTINDSMVAAQGENIIIMRPRPKLTKEEALRLAAYIVAMVGDDDAWEQSGPEHMNRNSTGTIRNRETVSYVEVIQPC